MFKLTHISLALSLSFTICAMSFALVAALAMEQYRLLFVTAFSVLLASVAGSRLDKLEGDFDLGMLMMVSFSPQSGCPPM